MLSGARNAGAGPLRTFTVRSDMAGDRPPPYVPKRKPMWILRQHPSVGRARLTSTGY